MMNMWNYILQQIILQGMKCNMKNVNQILRSLTKLGYRVDYSQGGSLAKIYHPDSNKPFYSFHVGEKGLHPLRRFARKNWDLNLENI